MAKDAKWYAGWLRMATTPTVEEKLTVIETADFIENLAAELEAVKRERDAACLKNRSIETRHMYDGGVDK